MTSKPGDPLPTLDSMDGLLTTREKCDELGVSRRTLYNWWSAGSIRPEGRAPGSLALCWKPGR